MNNEQAYNTWSKDYDAVVNKTRDVEAIAIRTLLKDYNFSTLLEIGCGTGKNTVWLATKAEQVTAVDFSVEMMNKASEKLKDENVSFVQADITKPWAFIAYPFDVVTCSLILEHIEDLNFVFAQVNEALKPGGIFYIGELHPFKQYQGSKARFETEGGTFKLECFIHNVSDYYKTALRNNFDCIAMDEWFDDEDETGVPRIVSFIFRKKEG